MTQLVVDRPIARSVVRPRRRTRPAQGSGREVGPRLRPGQPIPTHSLGRSASSAAHACVMPMPAPVAAAGSSRQASWRLTDRGVAVVIVTGLMLMVAALTVIGLTALRVTGDGYQATASQTLPR